MLYTIAIYSLTDGSAKTALARLDIHGSAEDKKFFFCKQHYVTYQFPFTSVVANDLAAEQFNDNIHKVKIIINNSSSSNNYMYTMT